MKNWTILIYANGNNEMEFEMHQSMLLCEKIGSNKDVNVVVQLSKANNKLVNIMRPKKSLPGKYSSWLGSRRFYVSKSDSILLENLGEVNMADPRILYDFISWGVENYPAKHYMVILGGHGISFIGNMTDLAGKTPYMMGTPEMCKVLLNASQDLNINIDFLVLDMCYMNSIEVIYELSNVENNPIKTMLTYIDEGPFEGLPYDILISTIDKCSNLEDINILTKNIVKNINLDI
ncbi:MAG: clostripain-related cysteine peptidase, partial [Clostridium sp.]